MNKTDKYYDLIVSIIKEHRKFAGLESILDDIVDDVYTHSQVVLNSIKEENVIRTFIEKIVSTSIVTVPRKLNFHKELSHKVISIESLVEKIEKKPVNTKLVDKMINSANPDDNTTEESLVVELNEDAVDRTSDNSSVLIEEDIAPSEYIELAIDDNEYKEEDNSETIEELQEDSSAIFSVETEEQPEMYIEETITSDYEQEEENPAEEVEEFEADIAENAEIEYLDEIEEDKEEIQTEDFIELDSEEGFNEEDSVMTSIEEEESLPENELQEELELSLTANNDVEYENKSQYIEPTQENSLEEVVLDVEEYVDVPVSVEPNFSTEEFIIENNEEAALTKENDLQEEVTEEVVVDAVENSFIEEESFILEENSELQEPIEAVEIGGEVDSYDDYSEELFLESGDEDFRSEIEDNMQQELVDDLLEDADSVISEEMSGDAISLVQDNGEEFASDELDISYDSGMDLINEDVNFLSDSMKELSFDFEETTDVEEKEILPSFQKTDYSVFNYSPDSLVQDIDLQNLENQLIALKNNEPQLQIREIYDLRFNQGLTVNEIVSNLGIEVEQVIQALNKITNILQ